MSSSLFVRAALVQALLVGALFAVLIVLPLADDFFEDYGWITGPVAWSGVPRSRRGSSRYRLRSPSSPRSRAGSRARSSA